MLFLFLTMLASGSQGLSVGTIGPAEYESTFWKGDISPPYPPIKPKDLTFQLFTGNDPKKGEFLDPEDKTTILKSSFNPSNPTKLATHGFLDHGNSTFLRQFKTILLKTGDYNFVQFDWSNCANRTFLDAIQCMPDVAKIIAKFINKLVQFKNASYNDVHIIGHSLGGQLVGLVGKSVGSGVLGRVTGLDPGSPKFEDASPDMRLVPTDAKIVDSLVTGLDNLGIKKVVGQINFYPNADKPGFQPECNGTDSLQNGCNHMASTAFFVETVKKESRKKYIATKCDSVKNLRAGNCNGERIVMGFELFQTTPGLYYISIQERPNLGL